MKYVKWVVGLFVIMFAGIFAILFAMGHMPNAGHFTSSIEINAPRSKVWAFLNDEQNMKKWISWMVDIRRSGPVGVGSKLDITMRDENNGGVLMHMESRCTEYAPESRMTEQMGTPGEFDGSETYTLTETGDGKTRLDIDSRFHFTQWFANLMSPVILPAAREKLRNDMDRLKKLLEAA